MIVKNLETQVAELEEKAFLLENIIEIINLQSRFNFYLELNHTDKIVNELFAQNDPDVSCEVADSGIYEGIDSIRQFWAARHKIQSIRGYMGTVMLETPFVQISKDGNHARGIWHGFGPNSVPVGLPLKNAYGERTKLAATWYLGKYENEYIKENGQWKIKKLHAFKYIQCPYEESWVDSPDIYSFAIPASECPPSRPGSAYLPYDPDGATILLPKAPEPRGLTY